MVLLRLQLIEEQVAIHTHPIQLRAAMAPDAPPQARSMNDIIPAAVMQETIAPADLARDHGSTVAAVGGGGPSMMKQYSEPIAILNDTARASAAQTEAS